MHSTANVTSTIQQGATYHAAWRRGAYPYPVQQQEALTDAQIDDLFREAAKL